MKVIALFFSVLVVALFFAPDWSTPPTVAHPKVVIECLDPSLEVYSAMWRDEIGRRFPNAIGILCHGGDLVEGEWVLGVGYTGHLTPAREIVARYQKLHKGRTIVLLACNTGNLKLNMPGVWYAKDSVFCIPDRALKPEHFKNGMARQKLSDGEMGVMPAPIVVTVTVEPEPTRWVAEPDVVGSIWEFVTD
jgi:hypothetical protein